MELEEPTSKVSSGSGSKTCSGIATSSVCGSGGSNADWKKTTGYVDGAGRCQRRPAKECQSSVPDQSLTSNRKERTAHSACSVGAWAPGQAEPWIFDSGATKHMCRNPDELVGSKRIKDSINVANGAAVPVVAAGALNLDADVAGRCSGITLSGTICVPDLAINLLSVSQICKNGHEVVFTSKICKVINCENGEVVAIGVESDGLYQLKQVNRAIACMTTAEDELMLWHRRLGHMNSQSMKILSRMSTGVNINCGELSPCVPCIKGKHQRLPFKRAGTRAEEVLELVHTDLCGPMESNSIGGNKYFLTFIDDASRRTIVYFLRSKKEVLEAFKDYKAQAENQTGRKIKRLRSDNGKEYVGRDFEDFLRSSGIIHETTVPYNPEQNGLAERRNRTIVEKARALLFDAGLDKRFWAEAVGTAVYLMNRSPAKGLTCTPEEQFTGKRPDLSHLRVFGAKQLPPANAHLATAHLFPDEL